MNKKLCVLIADYDRCFDVLFSFAPFVNGDTDASQAQLDKLRAWLLATTTGAAGVDVILACGSSRQSKRTDAAGNEVKLRNPKYATKMASWLQDAERHMGFVGLCHEDYARLASTPSTFLGPSAASSGGKPWLLLTSLLEDRISGQADGEEWENGDAANYDGGFQIIEKADALAHPIAITFESFEPVTYYKAAPKSDVAAQEQLQKLAIARNILEAVAVRVAQGESSYESIDAFFVDDRMDLLEFVGDNIGIDGNNGRLLAKLAGAAVGSVSFSTVQYAWREQIAPTLITNRTWPCGESARARVRGNKARTSLERVGDMLFAPFKIVMDAGEEIIKGGGGLVKGAGEMVQGAVGRRKSDEARRTCFTLVLTGGPCGGKTSSLDSLREALASRGYQVFCAPEVPTILLSNGGSYPGHDGGERLILWETAIIQLQRQLEDSFLMVAQSSGSEECVLIMDRGLLDIPAYIPQPQWQSVLAANQLTEAQLAARYDLVVHLTTAADGAAAFYGRETNAARNETPEEARELDARIHANWTRAHPKVVTLSNQGVDFEVKCKACVEAVVRSVDEKFGRAPANKPAFDPGLYTDAVTELLRRGRSAEASVERLLLEALAAADKHAASISSSSSAAEGPRFEVVYAGPLSEEGPDGKKARETLKSHSSALQKLTRLARTHTSDASKPLVLNDAVRFTLLIDEAVFLTFMHELLRTIDVAVDASTGVRVGVHELRNYWSADCCALMLILRIDDGVVVHDSKPPDGGSSLALSGMLCSEVQILVREHANTWAETVVRHHEIRMMPPGPKCDAAIARKAALWKAAEARTDPAILFALKSSDAPPFHAKEVRTEPAHWYASERAV